MLISVRSYPFLRYRTGTLIKKKKIFFIDKEVQNGAVAKSYMRKGFQIYEKMRKYITIYEEAVSHIYGFATAPFWISLYIRKIWFSFFISVLPVGLLKYVHTRRKLNLTNDRKIPKVEHFLIVEGFFGQRNYFYVFKKSMKLVSHLVPY